MNPIMALDLGEKRIGVALSDEKKIFSFPHVVLENDSKAIDEIENIIQERRVKELVIGLPRNMDGSYGSQAKKVKDFVSKKLKKYENIIKYEDETMTTNLAKEEMTKAGVNPDDKDKIDAYAAKVILEGYLERINNGK